VQHVQNSCRIEGTMWIVIRVCWPRAPGQGNCENGSQNWVLVDGGTPRSPVYDEVFVLRADMDDSVAT
jgi:hypothetical protein